MTICQALPLDLFQLKNIHIFMVRHLILLEDEPILRRELSEFLQAEGWQVEAVGSIKDFWQRYDAVLHRIAIIDLNLPDGDGMELIRQLRAEGNRIGIVVLTARGSNADRLVGLVDGADYYIPKIADLDEIAATLMALLRRINLIFPRQVSWLLEQGLRQLTPPGHKAISLSQQDFLVLNALMSEAGNIVSRQDIVIALGEDFLQYDQRRLDTQMRRLRRKVEEAANISLPVNTIRNTGYCFFAAATLID